MENSPEDILFFIVAITFVILLCVVAVISLLLLNRNRRLIHSNEILKMKASFLEQMNTTKHEVMEQVFADVSVELHDNVGQRLILALMNLSRMRDDGSGHVMETRGIVSQVMNEVREVSHMLSRDYWNQFSLKESLNILEMQLIRLKNIKTNFQFTEDITLLTEDRTLLEKDNEILIFRVIQELINNSLKHSKADRISLLINYEANHLKILYTDNGEGIKDHAQHKLSGLGMNSIKTRMELCKAIWEIKSSGVQGFIFEATIPYNFKSS